jgi:hypothetical protein
MFTLSSRAIINIRYRERGLLPREEPPEEPDLPADPDWPAEGDDFGDDEDVDTEERSDPPLAVPLLLLSAGTG